jgi:hypothetical protein
VSWMLWLDLAVGRGLEAFVLPNVKLTGVRQRAATGPE